MKKIFLAAAAFVALTGAANASGWSEYFDCGNGVVPIIVGWHGKIWLNIEENHQTVLEDKKISDAGIDTFDDPPQPLNADVTAFRFRIKWNGKTPILRYYRPENRDDKVTLSGHSCRFMGTEYDEEVKKYNGEEK
jgi:hypothetical protein